MQIEIERSVPEPNAAHLFGMLRINGASFCLTQEPPMRADRLFVPGECALAPGAYNLSVTYCDRHRQELPLLASMPHASERRLGALRIGMRVHHGLRAHEAYGEIVVGYRRLNRTVLETHQAFEALMAAINTATKRGEAVDVEVKG